VRSLFACSLLVVTTLATTTKAQLPRTRSVEQAEAPAANGIPRDPKFPYAGLWRGVRTMPLGSDDIALRFTVIDGKYAGVMLHPGGHTSPENNIAVTAAGLTFDHPNSGGGTWVYHLRLVGPDSIAGSLVLRDPPPNLTPAPKGTMTLTRAPSSDAPKR
jgi:hypothetical protein